MPKKSRRNSTTRDALFEGPETEYALDTYEYFWWRVLYQAINDADNLDNSNVTKRNQAKAAIIWLMRDIRDFEMVCLAARQDPDWFRTRAIRWLNSRYSAELLGTVFAPRRRSGGAKLR